MMVREKYNNLLLVGMYVNTSSGRHKYVVQSVQKSMYDRFYLTDRHTHDIKPHTGMKTTDKTEFFAPQTVWLFYSNSQLFLDKADVILGRFAKKTFLIFCGTFILLGPRMLSNIDERYQTAMDFCFPIGRH